MEGGGVEGWRGGWRGGGVEGWRGGGVEGWRGGGVEGWRGGGVEGWRGGGVEGGGVWGCGGVGGVVEGRGLEGDLETVRFGATEQARFGTVPVRFGTILQESIVETPMIMRIRAIV